MPGRWRFVADCRRMPEAERAAAPGLDDMTYRQAFMIGCFQCWRCGRVSPVPGPPFQVGC